MLAALLSTIASTYASDESALATILSRARQTVEEAKRVVSYFDSRDYLIESSMGIGYQVHPGQLVDLANIQAFYQKKISIEKSKTQICHMLGKTIEPATEMWLAIYWNRNIQNKMKQIPVTFRDKKTNLYQAVLDSPLNFHGTVFKEYCYQAQPYAQSDIRENDDKGAKDTVQYILDLSNLIITQSEPQVATENQRASGLAQLEALKLLPILGQSITMLGCKLKLEPNNQWWYSVEAYDNTGEALLYDGPVGAPVLSAKNEGGSNGYGVKLDEKNIPQDIKDLLKQAIQAGRCDPSPLNADQ